MVCSCIPPGLPCAIALRLVFCLPSFLFVPAAMDQLSDAELWDCLPKRLRSGLSVAGSRALPPCEMLANMLVDRDDIIAFFKGDILVADVERIELLQLRRLGWNLYRYLDPQKLGFPRLQARFGGGPLARGLRGKLQHHAQQRRCGGGARALLL